jgi:leucyl/phenylalanyl-tRNA--protein transferase
MEHKWHDRSLLYLRLGVAKSVEVWQDDQIVGGLYGIDLGHVFVEKACFLKFLMPQSCFYYFLSASFAKENYKLLDCQVYNEHLEG